MGGSSARRGRPSSSISTRPSPNGPSTRNVDAQPVPFRRLWAVHPREAARDRGRHLHDVRVIRALAAPQKTAGQEVTMSVHPRAADTRSTCAASCENLTHASSTGHPPTRGSGLEGCLTASISLGTSTSSWAPADGEVFELDDARSIHARVVRKEHEATMLGLRTSHAGVDDFQADRTAGWVGPSTRSRDET
jgi:hypothetical protein